MADELDKLPMDDEALNNAPPVEETQEQKDQRTRDEQGRFAPKQEPAGKPDPNLRDLRIAQERDEARREAQESKAAHAALQKRLDDMASLAKGDDPEAPPADPLKPLIDKIEGIDKRFTEQDETRKAQETHSQVMTYADQDEARFRTTNPDFPDAVQHYIVSRLTEMQALGVDQAQAEQILAQEAQSLLYQSAQAGRSPAETIYTMAKARGFSGGNVVPIQGQQTVMPAQPTGRRSLGTGGGAAGGAVTAQQIAQMDESDYMAFRSTPEGKRAIQRAMGG